MNKVKRLQKQGKFIDYQKLADRARLARAERLITYFLRGIGRQVNNMSEAVTQYRELQDKKPYYPGKGKVASWLLDYYLNSGDPIFYHEGRSSNTDKWMALRRKVFSQYGKVCMKCGKTKNLHIDHIKPFSKYPHLEFDFDNLQVLCRSCNSAKSNKDETDYRQVSITHNQ